MESKEVFLRLVSLGVGEGCISFLPQFINWPEVYTLANLHGLGAVVLDGVEKLRNQSSSVTMPEKPFLTQWIGEVLHDENVVAIQQKTAADMALIFHHNNIRTYVLKGAVVAECYPKPFHRRSSDMDCFLLPLNNVKQDVWEKGNVLMEQVGFEVKRIYYKNSTIYLPGLSVENHRFMTPFRGNNRLKQFERVLQSLMIDDEGEDMFEGAWLYRPPVMVTTLFLIEHAYSHFLHEGLTWRHVLDWMMYSKKHKDDIDWNSFDTYIDEYGFRKFYDSYYRLGLFLLGRLSREDLSVLDKKMLSDIWDNLDLHENNMGIKGKLELAGNTWRARWKYKYFAEINWMQALWIQAYGVLFDKHPKLEPTCQSIDNEIE